ncbi:hypothetical protein F5Y17DRAFT_97935 [Xylariaceae sp. FL0594]|nr:hypothetical protein F5Y17DRAFT_97935 [Xylariaceae sp. FL0594]
MPSSRRRSQARPQENASARARPVSSRNRSFLQGCVIAVAGSLGDDEAWTPTKVGIYVNYWKGTFLSSYNSTVTHLICTEETFTNLVPDIQAALRNKSTKIVTCYWLQQSIQRNQLLDTADFELKMTDEMRAMELKRKQREKASKGDAMDESLWHRYHDSTGFEYDVDIKRNRPDDGLIGERYLVTIWESNALPHNYMATAWYTERSRLRRCLTKLNETPVQLEVAFRHFMSFFRKRTGISWAERIEKAGTMREDYFQYKPPGDGKPIGLIYGERPSTLNGDSNGSALKDPASVEKDAQAATDKTDDSLAGTLAHASAMLHNPKGWDLSTFEMGESELSAGKDMHVPGNVKRSLPHPGVLPTSDGWGSHGGTDSHVLKKQRLLNTDPSGHAPVAFSGPSTANDKEPDFDHHLILRIARSLSDTAQGNNHGGGQDQQRNPLVKMYIDKYHEPNQGRWWDRKAVNPYSSVDDQEQAQQTQANVYGNAPYNADGRGPEESFFDLAMGDAPYKSFAGADQDDQE